MTTTTTAAGGRGARERILEAANELFYRDGINATGVEALAERAHVSKRTLYQHFGSKDDVVVAYLQRFEDPFGAVLSRADVPARQRLLDIFEPLPTARGCPYLNASAELADLEHPARTEAARRKQAFIDRLIQTCAEAGAGDPDTLGHRLALLSDGARSQSANLQSQTPVTYARALAETLLSAALD